MQITKFTDLSLRLLMYLTQEVAASPITINEVAQQFAISRNHLIKVVTRLNKLNWVVATRGRSGGLRLGIQPSALKLGDVLRELENKKSLINCNDPPCVLKGQCNLKEILDHGLNTFYDEMNQYTLQSIVDQKTQQAVIKLHLRYVA